VNAPNWTNLSIHVNDHSFNTPHGWASWKLKEPQNGFRYFRIIQTGPNSYSKDSASGAWKHTLVACGFELYGRLLSLV